MKRIAIIGLLFSIIAISTGCQSMYYAAWEKVGKQKRHLLKDNVEKARGDQQKASEEFKDALTRLRELYNIKPSGLEAYYEKLSADHKSCESRATSVSNRISKVNRVAIDLFDEWEKEIGQISSENLRTSSRQKLTDTRRRFATLLRSMRKAEGRMKGVLKKLNDQVLYLKHNLNAAAIGALRDEAKSIEAEITKLIKDMNASISEADKFIKGL